MRTAAIALVAAGAFANTASAAVEAKNIIYVIPDGWGPASQTVSRDLHNLVENDANATSPVPGKLPVDDMVSSPQRSGVEDRSKLTRSLCRLLAWFAPTQPTV